MTPILLEAVAKQRKAGWCPPPATMECSYCHTTYTAAKRYEEFLANFRGQYPKVTFPDKQHILKEKCGPMLKPWPVSTPLPWEDCKQCQCDRKANVSEVDRAINVLAAAEARLQATSPMSDSLVFMDAEACEQQEKDTSHVSECKCCKERVATATSDVSTLNAADSAFECDTCAVHVATATVEAAKHAAECEPCGCDEKKRILSLYRLYVLEEALAVHCYKHKDSCFKKGCFCRFRYPRKGLPESQFVEANVVPCNCDHCLEQHTDDSVCNCCTCTCPAETFIPTPMNNQVDSDTTNDSATSSNNQPVTDPATPTDDTPTSASAPTDTDAPSASASGTTTGCSQCQDKACTNANSKHKAHSLRYRQIRPLGVFYIL